MKDLAGRTAFVTGGANGIGLGLARVLLDQGCKVAIADIREDSIEAALASLDNREVMGVKLDVTSRDRFAEAADEVEERLGPGDACCSTMPASTCSGRSTNPPTPIGIGCSASISAA